MSEPQKSGTSTVGCIGWSVFLIVAIGGASYGGWYLLRGMRQEGGELAAAGPWGGGAWGQPYSCSGNDERTFEDLNVNLTNSPALAAGGNCHITLVNCNITAPTVIDASGNAQVTIRGGAITGTMAAISASGNAHVTVEGGAVISGAVNKSGLAQVTGVP